MQGVETILKLSVDKILIFYDLPQLFIAKDQIGTRYVCLYVESESDFAEYISIPVSKDKLNELIVGRLDLRSAFQLSEMGIWYFVTFDESEEFITRAIVFSEVDEKYLPAEDFYFPQIEPTNEVIVKEAANKGNAIVHLSFLDSHNRNSMDIELLGDFMKLFQNLVKYTYKRAVSHIVKHRPDLEHESNYTLSAFATSPGSFNVHLQSVANRDLFGNSNIEYALNRIDEMVGDISNENELIDKIKLSKGHAIGAYKKILENIIAFNINVSYKWVSGSSNEVHSKRINKLYAEKAIEIIESKEDLSSEVKEFVGVVTEVDTDNRKWRILNEDDGKSYHGKAETLSLAGITAETVRYKFTCEEIVEMIKVTGKEKISYNLLMFSILE